jgi:hypothetical protein
MSLPVPLAVRVVTSRQGRTITRDLRRLSFREVAQGGWASAVMSLHRPLSLQPDEIAHLGRVYVYDGRNARVVWEGRLDDPGRSAGADGQIWELRATGPAGHVNDVTLPLVYVDTRLDAWRREPAAFNALETRQDSHPTTEDPGLRITFARGTIVPTGSHQAWGYRALRDTGQRIARH